MASDGWIKLHRSILDHPVWNKEPFTWGQAWVDLILLANHEENTAWVRGLEIRIQRGQVGRSEASLAERWQWSRTKVRNFLEWLKKEHQIEQQKNNIGSLITIVNYEKHQSGEQQKEPQKDSRKTAEEQQANTNKNVKNVKKKNILCDFPENFEPDEKHLSMAREANVDVFRELQRFRDHHTAKGNKFKDWSAAFRTWLGNARRWAEEKNPSPSLPGLDKEALKQKELAELREKGAL